MKEPLLSQLYLKETAFQNLMQQRIYNVLLVASTYDAFMMEEDGRVEEQIFYEYMSLNLSSPPRVTLVNNFDETFEALRDSSNVKPSQSTKERIFSRLRHIFDN